MASSPAGWAARGATICWGKYIFNIFVFVSSCFLIIRIAVFYCERKLQFEFKGVTTSSL